MRHADGWETSLWDPEDVGWRMRELRQLAVAEGRDPATIETHLYHNINLNDDRAAAIEELEVWGQRTKSEIIRQSQGADPSAVVFDALQAAKAREEQFKKSNKKAGSA